LAGAITLSDSPLELFSVGGVTKGDTADDRTAYTTLCGTLLTALKQPSQAGVRESDEKKDDEERERSAHHLNCSPLTMLFIAAAAAAA